MARKQIFELDSKAMLEGTDQFAIDDDENHTYKVTAVDIKEYAEDSLAAAYSSGAIQNFPTTTTLVSLESGHGFVKQSTAGTQTDDTTDFVKGTQSLKLTTDGDNAVVFTRKASITPTIDMTGKAFVIWIKTDGIADLSEFTFYASSNNMGSFWYWTIKNTFTNDDDVWFPITLSWSDATASGTPDRTAINCFQWRVRDDGTGAVETYLGGIHSMNEASGGVVSITFDDNWLSQYEVARPIMDLYGFKGAIYTIPNSVGTTNYMTLAQLKSLQDQSGWDICGHHETNLTTVADPDATVKEVREWLANNGFNKGASEFAYPNGAWDDDVLAAVKKYFRSARGIQEFVEQPVTPDLYRLKVFLVINTTTTAAIQAAVTDAINNNDWLILVFHKIVTTPTVSTEYSTANFTTVMADINSQGIDVKTVSEVLNGF